MTVHHHDPHPADQDHQATADAASPDATPPLRAKIAAGLAVLACAACCALPVLVAGGLLTGAGAALTEHLLLAAAAVLVAAAAGMWWLKRRTDKRADAGQTQTGCASGDCSC